MIGTRWKSGNRRSRGVLIGRVPVRNAGSRSASSDFSYLQKFGGEYPPNSTVGMLENENTIVLSFRSHTSVARNVANSYLVCM